MESLIPSDYAFDESLITLKLVGEKNIDRVNIGDIVLWELKRGVLLLKVSEAPKSTITTKFVGQVLGPDGVSLGHEGWFTRHFLQNLKVFEF